MECKNLERKHNKSLDPLAKKLRKEMTKEERHLWYDFLRSYDKKFLRQKPFGKYILDFYCAELKLVIEIDGSQHYEDKAVEKDNERTEFLKQYKLKVLRIPNNYIKDNFDGVCEYIDNLIKKMS